MDLSGTSKVCTAEGGMEEVNGTVEKKKKRREENVERPRLLLWLRRGGGARIKNLLVNGYGGGVWFLVNSI